MIGPGGPPLTIYLATRPVDFRKGHDGLSALVRDMFGLNPFSGAVFVFRSKRADRIKILVWDQTGLVLAHKRLERGKFVWPGVRDGVKRLASADRVFMDETTAPVLDPGRHRTKKGFIWAIASDDRGHGGTDPPIVLFRYAPGRGGIYAEGFLRMDMTGM